MASARVTICLPFFNDRRQGLVIRLLRQESRVTFHNGDVDVRHLQLCADLPRHYSGVVAKIQSQGLGGRAGDYKYLPLRAATYDRLNIACLILAGFLVWRFLKRAAPRCCA
jgi:hypothetical protein